MTRETWLYFYPPYARPERHGRLVGLVADGGRIYAVIATDDQRLNAIPIEHCRVDPHRR